MGNGSGVVAGPFVSALARGPHVRPSTYGHRARTPSLIDTAVTFPDGIEHVRSSVASSPPNTLSTGVRPMPVLPVAHFSWQVLRTVKRSKKPPTGRALRIVPNRRSKDGTFLTEMVDLGLLARVTGTADAPFEATYALTERGEHAAEFGECERPVRARPAEPVPTEPSKTVKKKSKKAVRGKT